MQDLVVLILMYNLMEYNNSYSKTSGSLWEYYEDDPNDNMTDCESFKFKSKLENNNVNAGSANVEIAVPLIYLSNFWRTREIPLRNCEFNLMLTW